MLWNNPLAEAPEHSNTPLIHDKEANDYKALTQDTFTNCVVADKAQLRVLIDLSSIASQALIVGQDTDDTELLGR